MSEWKKVKIGGFLKRKKDSIEIKPNEKYKLLTVRLYHKGVDLRCEKLGSEIQSKMYKVSKGDFILSGIDARNGAFGIVPNELDGAVVTNDFWYFEIDESVVKKDFFFWVTKTPIFLDVCRKASMGETQRIRLQKDLFFNYEINCPTIDFQENFVNQMNLMICKINRLQEEIEKQKSYVRQLRQNILQEAIEGKLTADWRKQHPVQKGNPDYDAQALFDKIQAEKSETKSSKKTVTPITKDEIPFEIPTNWKWVRLGDVGEIYRGSGIKRSDMVESGLPCVRYGELYTTYDLTFSDAKSFIKKDLFDKSKKFGSKSVIFTLTGENRQDIAKAAAYLGDNFVAASGDLAFWTNHSQEPCYLSFYMTSLYFTNIKKKIATGDFIIHMSVEKIKKVPLPLPPLAEQKEIVARVERHLQTITQLETQIATRETTTKQLMQSILKDAFEE